MQTNLHRVSEFAVTAKQKEDEGMVEPEPRAAIKRFREHDSDSESEEDKIVDSSNIPITLTDGQDSAFPDPWHGSATDIAESDSRVFLSFDWENEDPCEKAVERYWCCLLLFEFIDLMMFLYICFLVPSDVRFISLYT